MKWPSDYINKIICGDFKGEAMDTNEQIDYHNKRKTAEFNEMQRESEINILSGYIEFWKTEQQVTISHEVRALARWLLNNNKVKVIINDHA